MLDTDVRIGFSLHTGFRVSDTYMLEMIPRTVLEKAVVRAWKHQ